MPEYIRGIRLKIGNDRLAICHFFYSSFNKTIQFADINDFFIGYDCIGGLNKYIVNLQTEN